jgi:hypothetical protein
MKNYQNFVKQLKKQGIFWSYDKNALLTDETVIEHTLLYADVPFLDDLFIFFEKSVIQDVWEKRIVPDVRYPSLNNYLAIIYFKIRVCFGIRN